MNRFVSIKTLCARLYIDTQTAKNIRAIVKENREYVLANSSAALNLENLSYNPQDLCILKLTAISELLNMYGVESIMRDEFHAAIDYVNCGETYRTTVYYDHNTGNYRVDSWGDYVESHNM